MHSSISNSEAPAMSPGPDFFPPRGTAEQIRRVRITIAFLLAGLALILIAAELSARYIYPRVSRIEKRIVDDEHEVIALANQHPNSDPAVLVLGNSLLLHGMDYAQMRQAMGPNVRIVRYGIENTEYLDWYYGLRGLFARGVKPDLVVLCLNAGQTMSRNVLDESSWRLFR